MLTSEDYRETKRELDGWPITVVTYRVGERFYSTVESVDPGARFARAEGGSREDAEAAALEKAGRYIKQTRRFAVDQGR